MDLSTIQNPKPVSAFFKKIYPLQDNFPALICHPMADESVFICRQESGGSGGGMWRKKLPQKVSDGKKITINYSSALSSMYIISQCFNNTAGFIHKQVFNCFILGYLHV
jgi:hypothetical protein